MVSKNKERIILSLKKDTIKTLDLVVKTFIDDGHPVTRSIIVETALDNLFKMFLVVGKAHNENKNKNKEDERKC